MDARLLFFPMIAMVLLTFAVAIVMFRRRVGAMKSRRIHPQKVAMSQQMATLIEDTRASDNFRNLFETPVLFYAAILTVFTTQTASLAHLVLAWAYVASRVLHSYLHCGPNIVMPRFYAYLAGLAVLLIMWVMIGIDLTRALAR